MSTLATLRADLQAKGYGSDTASAQNSAIQAALRRLYGLRRWTFLDKETTLVSALAVNAQTASLSTITDLQHIASVTLVDSGGETWRLKHVAPEELRALAEDYDTGAATPMYWSETIAGQVNFFPRAERIYSVRVAYTRMPVLPSLDVDPVVWPAAHTDAIVWSAIKDMSFRQRDWGAAQMAGIEYRDAIAECARAYGMRQRQSSDQVVSWSGWDDVR